MISSIEDTSESKLHGIRAAVEFRKVRDRLLRDVVNERKTKRQALESLLKTFDRILTAYLRIPATTYAGWIEWGPRAELDELQSAAADDAVWDRLVERLVPAGAT